MKNQKIRVSSNSPSHAGRVGYMQPEVDDAAEDMVVCSTHAISDDVMINNDQIAYFAVHKEYIEMIFQ